MSKRRSRFALKKRPAPRTAFKPGHKKVGGRQKGTQNKFTRDVKEAVLNALEKLGGEDWLVKLGKKEARAFAQLLGKAMPLQLTGAGDGPIAVSISKDDSKA